MWTRKRSKWLMAIMALGVFGLVASTQATVLFYEGFDYVPGSGLEGMGTPGGGDGMWVDTSAGPHMTIRANGTSGSQLWTGIPVDGYPQTGGFLEGERLDENEGHILLDSSVIATFKDGTITWMSYVSAATTEDGMNDNHHKPNVAIGQGELMDNRAQEANGQAIGGGGRAVGNAGSVLQACYWDDEDASGTFEEHRSDDTKDRVTPQQLIVMKIEWGADRDIVSLANFDISTPYTALTEADFDAAGPVSITSAGNLDQLTFDTLSFHGSRANFDEICIATRFADVVSGTFSRSAAMAPVPAHEADDVLRDVTLHWAPGEFAATHDVYFGTDFDDVNTATVPTVAGLTATSFDPGRLEFGRTYYWRVDEVNGSPDQTVYAGHVWSFEVEPRSIPVSGSTITATASSVSNEYSTPDKTVDGSGLDVNDVHSTDSYAMWFSASGDLDPWIQYDFGQLKTLDIMKVWNANTPAEETIGWGIKDVLIEYSVDGMTWDVVPDANQFAQATGLKGYDQFDQIDLGGIVARFVRLNIQSNWGGIIMSYGLSEVQFLEVPMRVRMPDPDSGAGDILPGAVLTWRAGRDVAEHHIYVSVDPDVAAQGTVPAVTTQTNSLDTTLLDLQLGQTYYWRVDEVNDAETPSVWMGPVWSFSTVSELVVDDFESYGNFSPDRPFQTWLDGFGYSADEFFPTTYSGNGTGSGVGHDIWSLSSPYFDGKIMEQSITLEGSHQSIPLYYDNAGGDVSRMDRVWATAQDWTIGGPDTLALSFYGSEDNTGGPLFAEINGQKVTYPDSTDLGLAEWQIWQIDLTSLGINLQAITSLSLGVEGAGSGMILIDDLRLQRIDSGS